MQNKIIFLVTTLLILSGCTRIHFDNGEQVSNEHQVQKKQWHHNAAFSLYEGSEPINLNKICNGDNWSSVETQVSFVNGLAGSAINQLGPIWYPKTVITECKKRQVPLSD